MDQFLSTFKVDKIKKKMDSLNRSSYSMFNLIREDSQLAKSAYNPFLCNAMQTEYQEVETLSEFKGIVKSLGKEIGDISMEGWVFQEVDFTDLADFDVYQWAGAFFWGCTFPEGITAVDLREKGARVTENDARFPYKAYRAFMYRQEELISKDPIIYEHYLTTTDLRSTLNQVIHDHSILDALGDYFCGKSSVAVMGGHAVSRLSDDYRNICYMARSLAQTGLVVITGGGPGAMEASNLGAYLANNSDEDVEEALRIIRQGNEDYVHEFENCASADAVLERFGMPTYMPSIGIPTWRYGHEPPNRFCTWHAKFFSNAVREEQILSFCNAGLIITPGGPGTFQEVFQAACINHYSPHSATYPLIFYNSEFFEDTLNMIMKSAKDKKYGEYVVSFDHHEDIVEYITAITKERNLPLTPNFEDFQEDFWISKAIRETMQREGITTSLIKK